MSRDTNLRQRARGYRKERVRRKVRGNDKQPRLCVFRSLRYTYAQLISDQSGKVYKSLSTENCPAEKKSTASVESAKLLGKEIAKAAKEQGFQTVVFDRNGYVYHGRVKAVAEGAREGGLQL